MTKQDNTKLIIAGLFAIAVDAQKTEIQAEKQAFKTLEITDEDDGGWFSEGMWDGAMKGISPIKLAEEYIKQVK